jgi:hypothetical protein
LDVEAFLKAYATLLHVVAGKLPRADGRQDGAWNPEVRAG